MSADKKLVQSLISRDEETEKLASKSIEELEVMFKEANGAALGPAAVLAAGGALGYVKGKAQKARGEKHTFGLPQVGSLFIPGGAAYQVGRAFGHEAEEAPKKKTKRASAFEMADAWGRELAKSASVEKVAISFNKINEASKFLGRVSRMAEKHGPAVKEMAGKAGKKIHEGVKSLGGRMGNIKDPIVKGMATGGAIGGVGGAAQGFLDPKENPYTGEKQRLRTAFRKGMAGAAGGAVSGALVGSMNAGAIKTAAMPGLGNIGSMAKNFVGSMKPVAQKAMASAAPHVAKGMNAIHGSSMGKSVGMGAAGGAALGAAKGLVAPGTDANGKPKGRIGAMVGGAAKGGLMGAGAGAAAKAGVTRMATKAGIPAAPKLLSA